MDAGGRCPGKDRGGDAAGAAGAGGAAVSLGTGRAARDRRALIRTSAETTTINVGGGCFQALEATLRRCAAFAAPQPLGDVFVDRDPALFWFVLQWLRTGQLLVSQADAAATLEAIRAEADFYGVPSLADEVSRQLAHVAQPGSSRGGRRSRRD